ALIGLIVASLCAGAFAQNIIVQQGDSLWSLARKHGTDVATLRELNGLQSDTLRVGQTLRLPGDGDAAPATTVTVRPGDTLFEIALAHGLTVEDLIAFNDLDGTTIHPGQELRLAAGDAAPEPLVVTIGSATRCGCWRGATTRPSTPSPPPTASTAAPRCASAT